MSAIKLRDGRLAESDWGALSRGRGRVERISTFRWKRRHVLRQVRGLDPGCLAVLDLPGLPRDTLTNLVHQQQISGAGAGVVVDQGHSLGGESLDLMDLVVRLQPRDVEPGGCFRSVTLDVERNGLGPTGSLEVLFRPDTLQFLNRQPTSIPNIDVLPVGLPSPDVADLVNDGVPAAGA